MSKFRVEHYEYQDLAGYRVPRAVDDGKFENAAEAERAAARLRNARCLPHFVVLVPDNAGVGLPLPETKPLAMKKAA